MHNFEREPKKDPRDAMEELKHGRFSMPEDEKERIIKKAVDEGRDPNEALREHQERLDQATVRLRESREEKAKEEAIDKLEREMNERFRDKKENK